MGVSKNNGTPKSSILTGFSIIFTIHFGGFSLFFGNTQMAPAFWSISWKLNSPWGTLEVCGWKSSQCTGGLRDFLKGFLVGKDGHPNWLVPGFEYNSLWDFSKQILDLCFGFSESSQMNMICWRWLNYVELDIPISMNVYIYMLNSICLNMVKNLMLPRLWVTNCWMSGCQCPWWLGLSLPSLDFLGGDGWLRFWWRSMVCTILVDIFLYVFYI